MAGSALLFDQGVIHEGLPDVQGRLLEKKRIEHQAKGKRSLPGFIIYIT